jgi:hypothetical protein
MGDAGLPPSLRRRDDRAAIFEDIEVYRGRSVEELSQMLSDLCRTAVAMVSELENPSRALDFVDQRSPASEALWLRVFGSGDAT